MKRPAPSKSTTAGSRWFWNQEWWILGNYHPVDPRPSGPDPPLRPAPNRPERPGRGYRKLTVCQFRIAGGTLTTPSTGRASATPWRDTDHARARDPQRPGRRRDRRPRETG